MRRLFLLFLLILTACQPWAAPQAPTSVPTRPPTLQPIPAGTPESSPTPHDDFIVQLHPDGGLFVGDQVSFEVIAPTDFDANGKSVQLRLGESVLGEQQFGSFGLGNRTEATFYWVWNTSGQPAGTYTFNFSIPGSNLAWQQAVTLRPAADLPYPEPNAAWQETQTDCCIIHYISNTEAERDLAQLETMLNDQASDAESALKTTMPGKIPITFLPRTLGHGGFTSDGIYVSYLDRNYAGRNTAQVIHHEMIHWIDKNMSGDLRPTILVEGLAVFLSGGHFKKEPIFTRAAALLDLGWYIPLRPLSDDFYPSQHEIGYIQAAALTGYLIQTYGWDAFNAFYRDIHPAPGGRDSEAIDLALKKHFEIGFDQLEQNLLDFLRKQPVSDSDRLDVRLTVAFYDTVRFYQRQYDPSAHYLTAWLVDANAMRERKIVADYLRHPNAPINQQIESLLVEADLALRSANYAEADSLLRQARQLLGE